MLQKLLSKSGNVIWLLLFTISVAWVWYAAEVHHQGPLAWLKQIGFINKLTVAFVFLGLLLLCWPAGLLCDFVTHQGMFKKRSDRLDR